MRNQKITWTKQKVNKQKLLNILKRQKQKKIHHPRMKKIIKPKHKFDPAHSFWTVEYTDFISAAWYEPFPKECPRYDIKLYDGQAPVMMEVWGMRNTF